MDKHEFVQQLEEIDEQYQQYRQQEVVLSETQLQELDATVYAHIGGMFNASPKSPATSEPGLLTTIKNKLFPNTNGFSPAYAVALLAVFAFGALALLKSYSGNAYELPTSLSTAGLHPHVELPSTSAKSMFDSKTTERRYAFLTGYTKANIDVLSNNDQRVADEFALWYHGIVESEGGGDPVHSMNTLASKVAIHQSEPDSAFWFQQGYIIEWVQLAAKDAIADMDTTTLDDALVFYKKATASIADYNAADQYLLQHTKLLQSADTLSTPADIEAIIDITRAMKILVQ